MEAGDLRKTLLVFFLTLRIAVCSLHDASPSRSKRQYQYVPPKINPDISENDMCGRPQIRTNMFDKIVGGSECKPHSWPWHVSVEVLSYNQWETYCGGSLVSNDSVVTAAHCVEGRTSTTLQVLVGCHNIYDLNDPSNNGVCRIHTVKSIEIHPGYTGRAGGWQNDVAIIFLEKRVILSKEVAPVCLPKFALQTANDMCVSTGWGITQDGYYSDVLKQVKLSFVDRKQCEEIYRGTTLPNNTICAGGYNQGGQDTCQGDSGGPWVCFIEMRWFLCGTTSIGSGCGKPNKPGLYTSIAYHYNWIISIIYDVDECSGSSSPCEQICVNTPGSYRCECDEGFVLVDKQKCKSVAATCGTLLIAPTIDLSIRESTRVKVSQHPWLVNIVRRSPQSAPSNPYVLPAYDHLCSGTVVQRGWVLASARCLADPLTGYYVRKDEILIRYIRYTPMSPGESYIVEETRATDIFPSKSCSENFSKFLRGEVVTGKTIIDDNCLVLIHVDEQYLPIDMPSICLASQFDYEEFEWSICLTALAYSDNKTGDAVVWQQYKALYKDGNCAQYFPANGGTASSSKIFTQNYPQYIWDWNSYTYLERYTDMPCIRNKGAPVYCNLYDQMWLAGLMTSGDCKTSAGCQQIVKASDYTAWIADTIAQYKKLVANYT